MGTFVYGYECHAEKKVILSLNTPKARRVSRILIMQMSQFLATLTCAIFTGAAIYINLVEHPARMSCGIDLAISEWAFSYKRATLNGFVMDCAKCGKAIFKIPLINMSQATIVIIICHEAIQMLWMIINICQ